MHRIGISAGDVLYGNLLFEYETLMNRLALLILSAALCSHAAFAASFVTAKGGDPTPISSNDGSFTFNPIDGGGVFFYENIGPQAIDDLSVNLTVTAAPGEMPYSFKSLVVTPTEGQLAELAVIGFQAPPVNTPLLNWDFSSYIFADIALTGTTTGFDCAGNANAQDACLTIDFTKGSIGVGQDFGFDLNNDFVADINTQTGTFTPAAVTNPPDGGFGGVEIAGDAFSGPATVPEPATFGLLGLAGAAFALVAFRRSRA